MPTQSIAETNRKQYMFASRHSPLPSDSNEGWPKPNSESWKIIVADDEQVVHDVTLLLLRGFQFEQKSIEIIHAYTGMDVLKLMEEHPDTAVLLLDVVMESDDAGLRVVRKIREQLNNHYLRIILRTGQPGQAPESEVINKYDINDYREKSELTSQRLYTCLTSALRSYKDIKNIEELAHTKESLEERIRERTREIMEINGKLQTEVSHRIEINEALGKSQTHLAEAQLIANVGSWEWELMSDKIVWSEQMHRIIGPSEITKMLLPSHILEFVPDPEKSLVRAALQSAMYEGNFDIEHQLLRPDGEVRHVRHKGMLVNNDNGEPVRMSSVLHDITEKYEVQESMRKFSSAIQQIADAVMITDVHGIIEYVNKAFERMTGFTSEEVIGKKSNVLKSDKQSPDFYRILWETLSRGEAFHNIFINRKKNGEMYHEVKTITPLKNINGEITHYISTGKDITERMLDQERLEHMAHHDALTGLPNRVLLKDRLEQLLSRKQWNDRMIAVMFLDLDRFKTINDTLGHDVGDALLCEVARRLEAVVRDGDTVARLGGDEFAIVLNDIAKQDDIDRVADKIVRSMQNPIEINGSQLYITTSIGISRCPGDASQVNALLKHADVALYKAKSMGRNTYQYYSEADRNRAATRFNLENCLREAVEKNEFSLHYQPQISLNSGKIIGVEALLRCDNELLIGISPAQFIPILEDTSLIIPVGEWVLWKACMDAKQQIFNGNDSYNVAVNLSIRQFLDKSLVLTIKKVLAETGLSPNRLELEITEGLLIEHINETAAILKSISDLGVKLSIDDFGTGYSSMNYLKRLPLDILKIDRSFVTDADTNSDDAAIATAIITLAHTLGMQVIAEGVEKKSQLDFLARKNCDSIQGYLISTPVPLPGLVNFISNFGTSPACELISSSRESRSEEKNK